MACRAEFFQKQVQQILNTWGSRLPENFDIMYYDGGWEECSIEENHIKCNTEDDIKHTYIKTFTAISTLIRNKKEYDYILRVNTSTWINVPLLDKFIQEVAKPDVLYAPELYSLSEAPCPLPLNLYARGNVMLIPKALQYVLITDGINLLYTNIVDDIAIGNVLNSFYIKIEQDWDAYLKHIKGLPFGWYKASPELFDTGHKLCRFGETGDQHFYNRFIAVQTKKYRMRDTELDNMQEFDDMMKDAPEPSLDLLLEYIENPSIFIGSVLGYVDFNTWNEMSKKELYNFEKRHKAIDDKENPNYSQEEYDRLHKF